MGCCSGNIMPLDTIEFDNPAMSAGAAGMQVRRYLPVFSGLGQFRLYILTFEKQSFCTPLHPGIRKTAELVEGSNGAGGDAIDSTRETIHTILDVSKNNMAWRAGHAQRLA